MQTFAQLEQVFFEEQWPKQLGRLRRQFGHQIPVEDLENLLSSAYLRFREAALDGRVEKQWASYWYRAAYNASIDWLRAKNLEREALDEIARDPEVKSVNFPAHHRQQDKSLMRQVMEALLPNGLFGPQYRQQLQQLLGHEGNSERLFQLIEACIGYLANPNHIEAILVQDQSYLSLRHKEAQKRLGASKGGPNRAYELGSKKILERLKVALDSQDQWSLELLEKPNLAFSTLKILKSYSQALNYDLSQWIEELKKQYSSEVEQQQGKLAQINASSAESEIPASALLYCVDEPKVSYREVLMNLEEVKNIEATDFDKIYGALKKKKSLNVTKKVFERFFGINSNSKTPRGLEAIRYALQVSLIAQQMRAQRKNHSDSPTTETE